MHLPESFFIFCCESRFAALIKKEATWKKAHYISCINKYWSLECIAKRNEMKKKIKNMADIKKGKSTTWYTIEKSCMPSSERWDALMQLAIALTWYSFEWKNIEISWNFQWLNCIWPKTVKLARSSYKMAIIPARLWLEKGKKPHRNTLTMMVQKNQCVFIRYRQFHRS